jgi:uncharacterized membrane protein
MIFDFFGWVARQVGFAICHQMTDRSFAFGGMALPVCARCTGLFLGFALTLAALLVIYRRDAVRPPSWKTTGLMFLLVLPMLLDGVSSYAGLRQTSNAVRLATGSLAGAAAAVLFFPLLCEQLRRRVGERETRDVPESAWSVPALLAVPVALSLGVTVRWPEAYWLWTAAVSIAILFTILALNFTIVSMVMGRIREEVRAPRAASIAAMALLAVIAELVISNRLHWLVVKIP